jgi:hypothetical protein
MSIAVLSRHPLVDPRTGFITPEWAEELATLGSADTLQTVVREIIQSTTVIGGPVSAPGVVTADSLTFGEATGPWATHDRLGVRVGDGSLVGVTLAASGLTVRDGAVRLDSDGLYVSPERTTGGGSYTNANAVRWTTSPDYRTAIWRGDDTTIGYERLNIENIVRGNGGLPQAQLFIQNKAVGDLTGKFGEARIFSRADYMRGELSIFVRGSNTLGYPYGAGMFLLASDNSPVDHAMVLGVFDAYTAAWGAAGGGSVIPASGFATFPALAAGFSVQGDLLTGAFGTITAYGDLQLANGALTEAGRSVPIGRWQSYVPSLTNLTLGNGTVSGKYARVGKTVHWRVTIILGSTSVVSGASIVSISLPVNNTAVAGSLILGTLVVLDSSTGEYYAGLALVKSATEAYLYVGAYLVPVIHTAPIAGGFATGDQITITGSYEEP